MTMVTNGTHYAEIMFIVQKSDFGIVISVQ
jgi:hypothetical protein